MAEIRKVTHKTIVLFHKAIADAHKEMNGFYRFNWEEISGKFRNGIGTPALLLESHSAEMSSQTKGVTNFNGRDISFMVLDFAGKNGDFDKQELVLDQTENIVLDIASYLTKCTKDTSHFLYGLFDISSFKYEKVGPIFDNMYGWNVLYTLKNHEKMCYEAEKWQWPTP